ncbi:hypothetical protein BDN71DRAFT_1433387 [Pleurotus eryngii]|uniref:Uncharacterized protein n=1 Tax=Pleurotus eryngii TaxID=5323 RepID=A0A9P5ZR78_PLEER|nr:hypothetical protein BDN71DRAFT_1433387 [Pleurotus eryngii]
MWWTPKEAELSPNPLAHRRFSVGRIHLTAFEDCVSKLIAEFLKDVTALQMEANSQWVNMLVNQLQIWFNRLSTFATTFSNILFLVAKVQRCWLDLRAYIDYMILFKQELAKLRSSIAKFPLCHQFISAITDNQTVAEEFASVGIPVWLLRDLSEFSTNTRIKTVVPLQETSTSIQPFPRVSCSIFIGPSNSAAKYDAIYKYACQHFSSVHKADPLAPLLLAADYTLVDEWPTKHFKAQALPVPNEKDIAKFHPVDHPFWPLMLPAWRDALAAVDHLNSRVITEWKLDDSGYRFPDSHLFVPSTFGDSITANTHVSSYYITWVNYQDAIWLAQSCPASPCHTTSKWQELLLLSMKEAGCLSFKANSGTEGRLTEMTTLLQQWVAKNQVMLAITNCTSAKIHGYTLTLDVLPTADVACMIVYVLCKLNFRSELCTLNAYMHTPSSLHCKAPEHNILLGYCFLGWLPGVAGGNILTVSQDDGLTRLCASTFKEQQKFILALAQVMSSWRNAPLIIRNRVLGQSATSISYVDANLEHTCAAFYTPSFFDRFARVPTVPCYLPACLPYKQ